MKPRTLLDQPPVGTIKIVTPTGTLTLKEARLQDAHAAIAPDWTGVRMVEVLAPARSVHYRSNLRTWWKNERRMLQVQADTTRGTPRVTEEWHRSWGWFGYGVCRWINGEMRELRLSLPGLRLGLTLSRPSLRPGHVSLSVPKLSAFFSLPGSRPHLILDPLGVWSYPYWNGREWGVNLLGVNGRHLFLYANGEDGEEAPRLQVLWRPVAHRRKP